MDVDAREVGHEDESVPVIANDISDGLALTARGDALGLDPVGYVVGGVLLIKSFAVDAVGIAQHVAGAFVKIGK